MKIYCRFAPLAAALIMTSLTAPIAIATESDSGVWLIVTATDRLPARDGSGKSRWHYWVDAQARYPDAGSGVNQLLIRPGVGYDISPTLSVWAGYARFRTHTSSGRTVTEDRFWQQLSWRARSWGDASLSTRLRLEERDLSTGSDTGIVLRAQLKYVRKLTPGGDTDFIASIEPFFDLRDTDWGADSGLSQNRIYLGLGWKLTAKSAIEAGYQNQYRFIDPGTDRMDHLGMVNFKFKF
ncbi:MAG: DUF2490 domain-containing protein [Gammaproteobacteria bacterium]|nr:DUF2490 domain-containing protein [Gammaproteobacteria bacterium]